MNFYKQQKINKMSCKSPINQQGQTTTEYLVIGFGLLAVWAIIEGVMDLLREHHDEYTWTITQPFF